MTYKLISNDKNARAGLLSINNIEVQTPTFMPVATRGAIKSTPHQYLDKTSILPHLKHLFVNCSLYPQ